MFYLHISRKFHQNSMALKWKFEMADSGLRHFMPHTIKHVESNDFEENQFNSQNRLLPDT